MKKVKELYNQLDLVSEYEKFEQQEFERITSKIENLNFEKANFDCNKTERVKDVLKMYAKKIFKRIK